MLLGQANNSAISKLGGFGFHSLKGVGLISFHGIQRMRVSLRQLCTLRAFRPYLRLLKAFNWENFGRDEWHSRIFVALGVLTGVLALISVDLLAVWKMADENFNIKVVSSSLPLIFSMAEQVLIFFVLVWQNRQIDVCVERLQATISKRKMFLWLFNVDVLAVDK